MMNISITRLALLNSLPFSAILTARRHISLKSCSISGSFSSIAYNPSGFSAHMSSFSGFLKTVLVLEKDCQTTIVNYSQVFNDSSQYTFCNCMFENISQQSAQGSCVYCNSSASTTFTSCLFYNCTSFQGKSAGCIMSNGVVTIFYCCFNLCYLSTNTSKMYTNVVYCTGSNLTVNQCLFFNCGPNNSLAGDSTIYSNSSSVSMINTNFTQCKGTQGGASISTWYSPSGSCASYINIFQCGQLCGFEIAFAKSFSASSFNVLNNTDFIYCYANINASKIDLGNIVFLFNGIKTEYIQETGSVSMSVANIYSDESFTNAELVSNYGTYIVNAVEEDECVTIGTLRFTSDGTKQQLIGTVCIGSFLIPVFLHC